MSKNEEPKLTALPGGAQEIRSTVRPLLETGEAQENLSEPALRMRNAEKFIQWLSDQHRLLVPLTPKRDEAGNEVKRAPILGVYNGAISTEGKLVCFINAGEDGGKVKNRTIDELMEANLRGMKIEKAFPVGTEVWAPISEAKANFLPSDKRGKTFGKGKRLVKMLISSHYNQRVALCADPGEGEALILNPRFTSLFEYGNLPNPEGLGPLPYSEG